MHYSAVKKQPFQLLDFHEALIEVIGYNIEKKDSQELLVVYAFFSQ